MRNRLLLALLGISLSAAVVPAQSLSVADIAQKSLPGIVTITSKDAAGKPFKLGTGFVVSDDGLIVTNRHVVEGAATLSVTVRMGDIYDNILIVDDDVRRDIALLAIKAIKLPVLRLGDSDVVALGQHVVAIGNPLGLTGTVSDGLISGIRDFSGNGKLAGFRTFQTSSPISPGSSGGPLFNDLGEVVGITSANIGGGQNLNIAIPINYARAMIVFADRAHAKTLAQFNAPGSGVVVAASTTGPHVTLTGQVKNPGTYAWTEGMTLEQAVALAGGFTGRAGGFGGGFGGGGGRIKVRRIVDGSAKEFDLKAQDKLLPDDAIDVRRRLF